MKLCAYHCGRCVFNQLHCVGLLYQELLFCWVQIYMHVVVLQGVCVSQRIQRITLSRGLPSMYIHIQPGEWYYEPLRQDCSNPYFSKFTTISEPQLAHRSQQLIHRVTAIIKIAVHEFLDCGLKWNDKLLYAFVRFVSVVTFYLWCKVMFPFSFWF